jgi:hypothetical protein
MKMYKTMYDRVYEALWEALLAQVPERGTSEWQEAVQIGARLMQFDEEVKQYYYNLKADEAVQKALEGK